MKKLLMLSLTSVCLFAATAFTLSHAPAEKFFGVVLNERLPFAVFDNFCGEPVFIEGLFHIVISENFSGNGNQHFRFHINAKGKGIGLASGAKYEWNDAINDHLNLTQEGDGCCGNRTITQRLRIIGQGQAPNFLLNFSIHITGNANGDFTVDNFDFSADCK